MKATLMNKTTPLLDVELEKKDIMAFGEVQNNKLMPIPLQKPFTLEEINLWMKTRRIPEKREGLKEARMMFRGFEEDNNFFSLSDQYWFRTNPKETWKKLNFFTNRYNEEVGKIFFEPWTVKDKQIKGASPDRTTNGVLRKRWVQDEEGASYLIKAGSVMYHQEPLSEVLASMMMEKLKLLDFVKYELVIDGMRFCSKCKNFVDENTEFVPASAIYNFRRREKASPITVYEHFLAMCKEFNILGAKEYVDNMIVIDHVMCNGDRHLNNFGFLRNVENGRIIGFAPLFDCGSAYWGTNNNAVKSVENRLFPEVEEKVMLKAIEQGKLNDFTMTDEMKALLEEYPDITTEKRDQIKKMVERVEKDIEKMHDRVHPRQRKEKKKEKKIEMNKGEMTIDYL